jgi:hypothetical protein
MSWLSDAWESVTNAAEDVGGGEGQRRCDDIFHDTGKTLICL